MILPRALSLLVSRSPSLLRILAPSHSLCTTTDHPEKVASRPDRSPHRPPEIPFQARVANAVHLVGTIGVSVKVTTAKDGTETAVSVLVQEKTGDSPQFWIPLIFQGYLAEVASWHLKEKDYVYVTGRLSANDASLETAGPRSSIRVIVRSVSFVEQPSTKKKTNTSTEEKVLDEGVSSYPGIPNAASFTKLGESSESLWNDLLSNPEQWLDYRTRKQDGSLKSTYPDFRNKKTRRGLWLDSAPDWVHTKLDELAPDDFAASTDSSVEELWKNLVERPSEWWDNRSNKLKWNHPDFKHKVTGDALWINSSTPVWVLPMLPPDKIVKVD